MHSGERGGAGRPALLLGVIAIVALAPTAAASNATLRTTLNSWSTRLAADAHSVALAAQRKHPRRMTSSAVRFRRDALAARAAVSRQRPSNVSGTSGETVGDTQPPEPSGPRAAGHGSPGGFPAATAVARKAPALAQSGNRLLVQAGTLLPA